MGSLPLMLPGKPAQSCTASDCWRRCFPGQQYGDSQAGALFSVLHRSPSVGFRSVDSDRCHDQPASGGGRARTQLYSLYNIVLVFAICQHGLATGTHVPPNPEPPATSLRRLSLWVVSEHWLWVPCFNLSLCCPIQLATSHIYPSTEHLKFASVGFPWQASCQDSVLSWLWPGFNPWFTILQATKNCKQIHTNKTTQKSEM